MPTSATITGRSQADPPEAVPPNGSGMRYALALGDAAWMAIVLISDETAPRAPVRPTNTAQYRYVRETQAAAPVITGPCRTSRVRIQT